MNRFYGFYLGDAESAVSRLKKDDQTVPEVLPVADAKSFITAYAVQTDGTLLVGERACYAADVTRRKIRFKSRFLKDPGTDEDVRRFAAGVLGELYGSGDLVANDDVCFYIGCPAGWDKNGRERYRQIFERTGYPPVKIISESRAAMVAACQSKHLQVGYDILSKPVLVVDIGSSTTDFAYIMNGKEAEMHTAGEVALGGGLMDEALLSAAVSDSMMSGQINKVFAESEAWKHYCEFAARRLKEKYFSDESYWADNECRESVQIRYKMPLRLKLTLDAKKAERLLYGPMDSLNGRSFKEVFTDSLKQVRDSITGEQPELLFLTGGVSKMAAVRGWCAEIFPDAVVILGAEPEFSVSRGLAWSGRIDEDLREFRSELRRLQDSNTVEDIVSAHISSLYRGLVDALVDPIIEEVALPVFRRWRSGEIAALSDTDKELENGIAEYLRSDAARQVMITPITAWLRPVSEELEEYTVPICVRHHVPYTALSLKSYFTASDLEIRIDAKNIFAVEEITWLIDSLISIIVGAICGGGGMALISAGPGGAVAGILASVVVLALGKSKMEEALLNVKLPSAMRKLVPESVFHSRMSSESYEIKANLYDSLENERNGEITARLVDDLSVQIEQCLTRMAEIVEIPLG